MVESNFVLMPAVGIAGPGLILEVWHDTNVHDNRIRNRGMYGFFMMIELPGFATLSNFGVEAQGFFCNGGALISSALPRAQARRSTAGRSLQFSPSRIFLGSGIRAEGMAGSFFAGIDMSADVAGPIEKSRLPFSIHFFEDGEEVHAEGAFHVFQDKNPDGLSIDDC